jgi:DNA-directed RNA polymerase specialized sigma24 family protein
LMDYSRNGIVFVGKDGQPLPEWLQGPLNRGRQFLVREFPSLNDPATVQNLLDQVGQRILEKHRRGEKIKGIESFVIRASRNAAIDTIRSADLYGRGHAVHVVDAATVGAPQDGLLPWWSKSLNPEEEDLLVRHLWMGDRHEEIAQALQVPVSTIRNRYSRIIEKLRLLWKVRKGTETS